MPDARRVFTTFEQPDLKSVFTFTVTAPAALEGRLQRADARQPEELGDGKARLAVPDHQADVDVHHRADRRRVPRASTTSTRASTAPSRSATTAASRWSTTSTATSCSRSPSRASSSSRRPSTSPTRSRSTTSSTCRSTTWARWRTPARVTLRDEYLPRSRQDALVLRVPRLGDPARDGAHVVRRPGHHAVVGRPLAQRVVRRVGLLPRRRREHRVHRVLDRLHQRPQELGAAPGPAALDPPDRGRQLRPAGGRGQLRRHHLRQGRLGAQAARRVGRARARSWPACGSTSRTTRTRNSEFVDLLTALEKASGRELDAWAKEWLQTVGRQHARPGVRARRRRRATRRSRVAQTAAADYPTLRRHRIGIGLYDVERTAAWSGAATLEIDVEGELTDVAELVGEQQPDLLLLNDGDLTYAKIRLDERSLATVVDGLGTLDDSLARALCWGAAWDMTRDAEMTRAPTSSRWCCATSAARPTRSASAGSRCTPRRRSTSTPHPATAPRCGRRWERGLRELLHGRRARQRPPADLRPGLRRARRTPTRRSADLAGPARRLARARRPRGRHRPALGAGHRAGQAPARADEARIDEELARDNTISGQEHAAAARAVAPDRRGQGRGLGATLVERDDVANETQRSDRAARSMRTARRSCSRRTSRSTSRRPTTIWERARHPHGVRRSWSTSSRSRWPSAELLDRLDPWLEDSPANPAAKRYVREGRADVARALAAQASATPGSPSAAHGATRPASTAGSASAWRVQGLRGRGRARPAC